MLLSWGETPKNLTNIRASNFVWCLFMKCGRDVDKKKKRNALIQAVKIQGVLYCCNSKAKLLKSCLNRKDVD